MRAAERRNRASAEAAEWWSRLQSKLTREERGEWVDWLRESHIHVAEMLHMAQLHGTLEQFEQWLKLPKADERSSADVIPLFENSFHKKASNLRSNTKRRVNTLLAIAASLLLITLPIVWLVSAIRGQSIATDRGERREIVLEDGTILQIDPETQVRVRFERDLRRVHLDHGRALFRVAKNPRRPFLVETNIAVVRAVGTAFGVERAYDSTMVTVAEGKVAVAGSSPWFDSLRREPGGNDMDTSTHRFVGPQSGRNGNGRSPEVMLTADQQITVHGANAINEAIRKVDSQQALAWAQGRLIFEDVPLMNVVAQFNRYNRMQIRIADNSLAHQSLNGTFNASDPESLIAFLRNVVPLRVEREGQVITLATSAPR